MKKYIKLETSIYVLLIIINFLISIKIFDIIPIEREKIIITATNLKNENSQGNEIWLRNILINGKECEIPRPSSGNWIWGNINGKDILGWRTYYRPNNITNKIELEIPIGRNRDLIFDKNIWRGVVNINTNGTDYILDCYENTTDMNNIILQRINDTSGDIILRRNIYNLVIISILIIIFFLLEYKLFKNYILNPMSKYYYKNKKEDMLFIFMLFTMTIIIFKTSNVSMWNDEIITLASVYEKNSILDSIKNNINFIDMTPPLFNILSYFWVKILPCGELYLYILPTIFVIIGIILLYILSSSLFSKKIALIISFISTTSNILILNGSHEYRPYSLLFMMSTFVLYSFFYKQNKFTKKSLLLFAISMILLSYTHYYGIIFCFCIFLYDTFINLSLKKSKYILSYIFTGIAYLPWVIIIFLLNSKTLNGWATKPTIKDIIDLPFFLLNDEIMIFLFFMGVIYIISIIFTNIKNKNKENSNLITLFIIMLLTTIIVYILSIYILNGFFYKRYFIVILPIIFLITGYAINLLIKNMYFYNNNVFYNMFISLFLIISINNYKTIKINPKVVYQPYRETLNFIKSKTDINNDDVCIIVPPDCKEGVDYFITNKGKMETPNILNSNELGIEEFKEYIDKYNKIYIVNIHIPISIEFENIIKINYKKVNDFQQYNLKIYEK